MSNDSGFSDPSARWWLARPGEQPIGPFAWTDLIATLRGAGGVGEWLACREGGNDWKRLADDPAVVAALAPAAPPPTPFGAPASTSVPPQSRFQVPPPAPASATAVHAIAPEDRTMAVLLHLSTFGGIVIPGLGLLLPLILWLTNRQRPAIDAVGKEVMNYVILAVIATVASILLVLCLIGYVLLLALVVATIVFPIIGAVKASNGEFFRYPLPFRILR